MAALFVAVLGPTAGSIAASGGGEPCIGCAECEKGHCGDGEQPGSHHHCCTTCCMFHTAFALPAALVSTGAPAGTPSWLETVPALIRQTAETPYRPPRA
jgi:hypothetical protein